MKIVIAAPMPKSPSALTTALATKARLPRATRNGRIGTSAPMAKSTNEVSAASHAEPPSWVGSMPSSSRARASIALLRSASRCLTIVSASLGLRPLAS